MTFKQILTNDEIKKLKEILEKMEGVVEVNEHIDERNRQNIIIHTNSNELDGNEFIKYCDDFQSKFYKLFNFYPSPDIWSLEDWFIPYEDLQKVKGVLEK